MERKIVYPLSADPVHLGHIAVLKSIVEANIFDKVYVAVGNDVRKKYLFSLDEHVDLIKKSLDIEGVSEENVVVEGFSGFLRSYAVQNGVGYVLRGARNSKDFDYELSLSAFNGEYGLKTFIVTPEKGFENLSSSLIKAIVVDGGDVSKMVTPIVKQSLEERLGGRKLIGVTGNMGAGKSTFCEGMVKYGKENGDEIHHIDYDKLVHSLYEGGSSLSYKVRREIRNEFGEYLFDGEFLDRKKLSQVVFGDKKKADKLADILRLPLKIELENKMKEMKGLVLLDAAYFTEYNMLPMTNYNVILVGCEEDERIRRISERDGYDYDSVKERLKLQHSPEEKRVRILEAQGVKKYGRILDVDSTEGFNYEKIMNNLKEVF